MANVYLVSANRAERFLKHNCREIIYVPITLCVLVMGNYERIEVSKIFDPRPSGNLPFSTPSTPPLASIRLKSLKSDVIRFLKTSL